MPWYASLLTQALSGSFRALSDSQTLSLSLAPGGESAPSACSGGVGGASSGVVGRRSPAVQEFFLGVEVGFMGRVSRWAEGLDGPGGIFGSEMPGGSEPARQGLGGFGGVTI